MKVAAWLVGVMSTALFAVPHPGEYRGNGTWKMTTGATGTWTETATVQKVKEGLRFQSTLKVFQGEQVMHDEKTDTVYVVKGDGFFEIKVGDAKTGEGYCFRDVCHHQYQSGKEYGEETMQISSRGIRKMGSSWGQSEEGPYFVAWHGGLKRVK